MNTADLKYASARFADNYLTLLMVMIRMNARAETVSVSEINGVNAARMELTELEENIVWAFQTHLFQEPFDDDDPFVYVDRR